MQKYVVIRVGGKQYKAEEGEEVLVDKLQNKNDKEAKAIKKSSIGNNLKNEIEVLLSVDGNSVKVGKPVLSGSDVTVKVLSAEEKGEKLYVFKYKAKSRYRKKIGFRPKLTRLLIEKIK